MNSFAFSSCGVKIENGKSVQYANKLKAGDIVGCWISKNDTNVIIRYTINGDDQGIAWVRGYIVSILSNLLSIWASKQ